MSTPLDLARPKGNKSEFLKMYLEIGAVPILKTLPLMTKPPESFAPGDEVEVIWTRGGIRGFSIQSPRRLFRIEYERSGRGRSPEAPPGDIWSGEPPPPATSYGEGEVRDSGESRCFSQRWVVGWGDIESSKRFGFPITTAAARSSCSLEGMRLGFT